MKNPNVVRSFNNAISGILHAVNHERNMRLHLTAAVGVAVLSMVYKISRTEMLTVCLTVAGVIICELFNTAIENVIDMLVDVYHPRAKIAKDVAAGAVLVSALAALFVGYMIFFDRISRNVAWSILWMKMAPLHIAFIALFATILAVIILKAFFDRGSFLHGGMPSGHTALAFSGATAIALWSEDAKLSLLAAGIALLVAQSRWEGKIHSVVEVVAGALLGFLCTWAVFQIFFW